jgi:hypothetical protein
MDHEPKQPAQHPDDLKQFERELRALVPRGPNIEVARLMYVAGQASMAPVPSPLPQPAGSAWYWPLSTAISSSIAIWLAALLIITEQNPSLMPTPQTAGNDKKAMPTTPAENPPTGKTVVAIVEKSAGGGDVLLSPAQVTAIEPSAMTFEPSAAAVMPDSLSAAIAGPGTYGSLTRSVLRDAQRDVQRPVQGGLWGW